MDKTQHKDQKQTPNPTCINNVVFGDNELGVERTGKTIVFTAFLQETFYSKEGVIEGNCVTECWYPTIFFYDLKQNRTVWEIFGAE